MFTNNIQIDENYIIKMRRYFHQHPELSGKEYKTRDKIMNELRNLEIPCQCVCETGVIGIINGDYNGLVVGLRADTDALPIVEKNTCDYKSENEGIMHACGHDSHMAMLLGAAKALKSIEDQLDCTVKLIFQPAEETMSGAKDMCEIGIMDDVGYLFGMHVGCDVDEGSIGLTEGPVMAAVDAFKITVHGKSAHGAMPNTGIDSIVVGSQIVSNIQSIISREIPPSETVVISIGTIKGGTANNIIAGEVELEGTFRYFNRDLQSVIRHKMEEKCKWISASYGATATVDFIDGLPPVNNDADMTEVAIKCANKIGITPIPSAPVMISEDYSILADGRKSVFGFLGIRQESHKPMLHTNNFDIDESILKDGASMHVHFVLEAMNK